MGAKYVDPQYTTEDAQQETIDRFTHRVRSVLSSKSPLFSSDNLLLISKGPVQKGGRGKLLFLKSLCGLNSAYSLEKSAEDMLMTVTSPSFACLFVTNYCILTTIYCKCFFIYLLNTVFCYVYEIVLN